MLNAVASYLQRTPSLDALRFFADAVLTESLVGQLLRPLVTALSMFPSLQWPSLSLQLLPSLSALSKEIDQLTVQRSRIPRFDQKVSVEKTKIVESNHPYRTDQNKVIYFICTWLIYFIGRGNYYRICSLPYCYIRGE